MFINIEGIDGAGKSTFARLLCEFFQHHAIAINHTFEPGGGTKICESIREQFLHGEVNYSDDERLILLFADRLSHVTENVLPSLEAGYVVINERFTPSTWVYQVLSGEGEKRLYDSLDKVIARRVKPDVTFILDVDHRVALERLKSTGKMDRFEREKEGEMAQMRQYYLDYAAQDPAASVVDVNKDIDALKEEVELLGASLVERIERLRGGEQTLLESIFKSPMNAYLSFMERLGR